jgi:transcriptional regulator with XRE-family HTH domain
MKSRFRPTRLGKKIKYARTKAKLRQKDLARLLDCTTGAVCQWETDRTTPEIGFIMEISKLTQMSVTWFVDDSVEIDSDSNALTEGQNPPAEGMPLRDYFAAKAMQGMASRNASGPYAQWAKSAYMLADVMLKEREVCSTDTDLKRGIK